MASFSGVDSHRAVLTKFNGRFSRAIARDDLNDVSAAYAAKRRTITL